MSYATPSAMYDARNRELKLKTTAKIKRKRGQIMISIDNERQHQ